MNTTATFQIGQSIVRIEGGDGYIGSTGVIVEINNETNRVRVQWDEGQYVKPVRTWIKAASVKA